jgi:membrane-associated protein
MNTLSDWVLTNLSTHGMPVLLLTAYVGSLGIPFPITLVIIAAGAASRQGILDWRLALLACLLGATLADNSEYILGRLAGRWLRRRFEQTHSWQKAATAIQRQGGWAILLTRFWLTPLAPAVNMLAGSRYSFVRFLIFDLTGELLWVLLYGGLGYLFAAQWELVSQAASGFTGLSVAAVLLAGAVYFLVQRRKKAKKAAARDEQPIPKINHSSSRCVYNPINSDTFSMVRVRAMRRKGDYK